MHTMPQSFSTLHPVDEKLRKDYEAALRELAALRNSTSWRITWPLRMLVNLALGRFAAFTWELRALARWLLPGLGTRLRRWLLNRSRHYLAAIGINIDASEGAAALSAIVAARNAFTKTTPDSDPLTARLPANAPAVDISIVTFNSRRWVADFVESVLLLDYPRAKLSLHFVDNGSTDDTVQLLFSAVEKLVQAGFAARLIQQKNRGFGAGHNRGIQSGKAPFCLVTNIDLNFAPDALARVVATAVADTSNAAAWELRQKPYEHPKFYDPVTGTTNWNSHACVLLKRTALHAVGGYDENIFMYGEDVELSYRLRRAGWLLRYCPAATVTHHAYEHEGQIKPLQYTGSTFANLYLRLKYGSWLDAGATIPMGIWLLSRPEPFPGARRSVACNLAKLLVLAPSVLAGRTRSDAHFPFRRWDFDIIRDGAFVAVGPAPTDQPLVTVITRTYLGRDKFLRQAILSVAHQTYANIEHIIVEDGGADMRQLVENLAGTTGCQMRHIGLGKSGRSAAGNAGLAAAAGRWCLFLDDDDLLFCDHVEVLVEKLLSDPGAAAGYSLAWQVATDTGPASSGYVEISREVPLYTRQCFDPIVLAHHNYMAIQSVLFERRLFIERGGFEEDFDALEDWILWQKYAAGNRFVYAEKVTSMFRTPSDLVKQKRRDQVFGAAYASARARTQLCIGALQLAG